MSPHCSTLALESLLECLLEYVLENLIEGWLGSLPERAMFGKTVLWKK